jgi:hypothetical protein
VKSLLAIACVACSSPTPPPDAAPTNFTFDGSYTIDSTVTSVVIDGTSYASGDTADLQLAFPSYAAAQGSAITMTVTAGSDSGSATITPDCPVTCGDALINVSFTATVSWQGQPVVTIGHGFCSMVGGSGCGFAN